jgi:hypothetical protein
MYSPRRRSILFMAAITDKLDTAGVVVHANPHLILSPFSLESPPVRCYCHVDGGQSCGGECRAVGGVTGRQCTNLRITGGPRALQYFREEWHASVLTPG